MEDSEALEADMLVVWIIRHYEMYLEQLSQEDRAFERSLFASLRQHIETNAEIICASDAAMRAAVEREKAEMLARIIPLMLPRENGN